MKKINLSQKLSLNKSLVSNLNAEESAVIKGGSAMTHCFCAETKVVKCKTIEKACGVVDSVMKTCYMCDDISEVRTGPTFC